MCAADLIDQQEAGGDDVARLRAHFYCTTRVARFAAAAWRSPPSPSRHAVGLQPPAPAWVGERTLLVRPQTLNPTCTLLVRPQTLNPTRTLFRYGLQQLATLLVSKP